MGIIRDFKSFSRMNEDLGRNFVVTVYPACSFEYELTFDGKDCMMFPADDGCPIFGPYTKNEADNICAELNERIKEIDNNDDYGLFRVYELSHDIESELKKYLKNT